jgi:hypothetical protein
MMDEAGVDRAVIVPPTLEGRAARLRTGGGETLSGSLRHHGAAPLFRQVFAAE